MDNDEEMLDKNIIQINILFNFTSIGIKITIYIDKICFLRSNVPHICYFLCGK
jgi:hypothetical protein